MNPFAVHTAFAVSDYEAVRKRLIDEGLELLETGAEAGQMWVRDPDSNIIELIVERR